MICIGLERFVKLPIIQAPKQNSKLHSEMWMNAFFAEGPLGARAECAPLHEAWTSDTGLADFVGKRRLISGFRMLSCALDKPV
jgi:hypothetical protein